MSPTLAARAWPGTLTLLVPGLALALLVAVGARLVSARLPAEAGEVVAALVLGLAIGTLVPRSPALEPGLRFAVTRVLRVGVVLLAARLSLAAVIQHGAGVVVIVAVVIALALALGLLAGRAAGLPLPLALLIAAGTAICGNSAILATAPVVGAEQRQVSIAVATITTFGLLAVLAYPLIGHALGLDDSTYGRWAGLAVNDTSQVVAASLAYSQPAADVAIVVKLVRNLFIAPVLLGVAWAWSRRSGSARAGRGRVRDAVPLFVLGFLAVAAMASLGWLDVTVAGRTLAAWMNEAARACILVAVAAIGLATRPGALVRTGARPFALGLACSVVVSATALALVLATRGAG